MAKIPIEILLKYSRKECGELKSYIQELEDKIKKLNAEITRLHTLYKSENKELKLQIKSEEMYNTINTTLNNTRKKLKDLQRRHIKVCEEVIELKRKLGML